MCEMTVITTSYHYTAMFNARKHRLDCKLVVKGTSKYMLHIHDVIKINLNMNVEVLYTNARSLFSDA